MRPARGAWAVGLACVVGACPAWAEDEDWSARVSREVDPAWTACETREACVAAPAVCGSWAVVNRDSLGAAAAHFARLAAIVRCSPRELPAPMAICEDGRCAADPWWLDAQPEHQACRANDDCVVVGARCGDCACGVAVHQRFAVSYHRDYLRMCAGYAGPHCDFYCPTPRPVCRDERCALAAEDPSAELPAMWAHLFDEAEVIAAVRIHTVEAAALGDGPVRVHADVLKVIDGEGTLPTPLRFDAGALIGPDYQPHEQRIVFLKRFGAGEAQGWVAVEAGKINLRISSDDALARCSEPALRAFLRRVSAQVYPPPYVEFQPTE